MGDAGDVRGYYAALGLAPGASNSAIKDAYRRLAKDCHPDRSHVTDGGQRFREISEAYETLSDPELKASYDSVAASDVPPNGPSEDSERGVLKPIACSDCGKITAQPRRLEFWRVTSFLFGSHKTPVEKIYCRSCASKEQWKSTIWTSMLGWWGIPWGPAWAIGHGFTNALGGARDVKVDEALMWHNALAFAAAGEGELAVGLGNILRKSDNPELAQQSADLIRFFSEQGVDKSATLTDAWPRSVARASALLLVAFAVPGAAALAFVVSTSSSPNATVANNVEADDPFADLVPAVTERAAQPTAGEDVLEATFGNSAVNPDSEEAPPETAACSTPPANGEILSDGRQSIEKGHVLQIENGTRGDAIVKLRDADTARTVASFFVQSGRSTSLNRIPDGTYSVQYAYGDRLGSDCRTFIQLHSAGEFPGSETMKTEYQEELGGTRIVRSRLSYTLYSVPGGNVRPDHISAADFNKP